MNLLKQFEAARRISAPIVVVRTLDQFATVEALAKASADHALVQWDAVRGIGPVNVTDAIRKKGDQMLKSAGVKPDETIGFAEALIQAHKLLPGSVLFAYNAHRQLAASEPAAVAQAVQAVANLREAFKANFRMLVLMGPSMNVPMELEQDVIILDHALPDDVALREIVVDTYKAGKLTPPKDEALVTKAVDALGGLSSFAAEQVAAMSLTEKGLDLPSLWERKRIAIEQTRGLRVWRGAERFTDLVGLDSIKKRLQSKLKARTPIGCVVFVDEVDKVLANVEQDTSGVRMDQLRTLLTEMENNEWRGLCAVGVAGGGKSAIAKAFGNEAGVPTIQLDLGDMEGPHVGESEQMLRQAIAVLKAIGRGHCYFIATSNNATVMRPELQRRFTDGFFFFDLMSQAERSAAWTFYTAKYDALLAASEPRLSKMLRPDDTGWTGAEIRNCVREAWDSRTTLVEAAKYIVPMATSRADEIERLRHGAHGRFLDANRPGPYAYDPEPMAEQVRQTRAIALNPMVEEVIKRSPMKES
jgi:hypothetical protein